MGGDWGVYVCAAPPLLPSCPASLARPTFLAPASASPSPSRSSYPQVMKMVMPLLSPAGGVLRWVVPEGGVLGAGELLAQLELDAGAVVAAPEPYPGTFPELGPPQVGEGVGRDSSMRVYICVCVVWIPTVSSLLHVSFSAMPAINVWQLVT